MRDSILWQWSSEYLHSCESGDSKHYLYTWCLILNGCLYQFSLLYDPSLMYIVLGFKLANIHDSIMRWGWKFFIQNPITVAASKYSNMQNLAQVITVAWIGIPSDRDLASSLFLIAQAKEVLLLEPIKTYSSKLLSFWIPWSF